MCRRMLGLVLCPDGVLPGAAGRVIVDCGLSRQKGAGVSLKLCLPAVSGRYGVISHDIEINRDNVSHIMRYFKIR